MSGIPVVRLEVERMKTCILTALMEQTAQMDSDIRAAVEAACAPDNIRRVLAECTLNVLREALTTTLKNHFLYGEGRKDLKAAVARQLDRGDAP